MPPVIKFNGYGDFSWLVCFSLHTVVYEDEQYPTALHLFEARKFPPHRLDLVSRIRQAVQARGAGRLDQCRAGRVHSMGLVHVRAMT